MGSTFAVILAFVAFLVVFSEIKSREKNFSEHSEGHNFDDSHSEEPSLGYPKSSFKSIPTAIKAWGRTKKLGNSILDLNKKEASKKDDHK